MECARGLCCALRFGPLRRVRPLAPGKFRKKRGSAKCGRPLLLDMTIARRRQGFGFANGVGRLLSVVHVATSCVINVSPGGLIPRGGILARAVPNLRLARDASGRRGGGFRGSHVPDRRI